MKQNTKIQDDCRTEELCNILDIDIYMTASRLLGESETKAYLGTALDECEKLIGQAINTETSSIAVDVAEKVHAVLNRLIAVGAADLAQLMAEIEIGLRNEKQISSALAEAAGKLLSKTRCAASFE